MSNGNNPNGGNGGPFGPFGPGPNGGMQYPMNPFFPMVITRNDQQNHPEAPQEPPMRVQVAMGLAAQLTRKTMPQVAATENNIEIVPGQSLTGEEEGTRATALNMLSHYFAGKLEPDRWEQQGLHAAQGVPTMQFKCICSGHNTDCPFCGGDKGTGMMDIVVKYPRKVTVDAQGNIVSDAANTKTLLTNGTAASGMSPTATAPKPPQQGGRGGPGAR
jgi:hypothetical protein